MLDANGDGISDAADVAYLNDGAMTYLGERLTEANGDLVIDAADLADVNLDGVINARTLSPTITMHSPMTMKCSTRTSSPATAAAMKTLR